MKNIQETASDVSQIDNPKPPKKTFVREYVLRIEGEPTRPVLGWGSKQHEEQLLNHLHAIQFVANEVERYFQTSLENRVVTIKVKL